MRNETQTKIEDKKSELKLNPYPNGWFVVAFSQNLKVGEIKSVTFMGRELVLYRTENEKACVSDAFCPHMGAHFAHGGKVLGDEIQCPFHGFRFNCSGDCTATGYGTKPPPTAKLQQWTVTERNGLIFVYHSEDGGAPTWELPTLDTSGWTPLATTVYHLDGHPQETTENIADIGHFNWIHGYDEVAEESKAKTEGPVFSVDYGFTRNASEFARFGKIRVHFTAEAHGLGYSYVDTYVPRLGLKIKNFVLPTPTKDGKVELRLAMAIKSLESSYKMHPLAALIPKKILARIALKVGFKVYCNEVSDDFKIWNNKKYVIKPPIAKGDGPIPQYRKWASQFYKEQFIP